MNSTNQINQIIDEIKKIQASPFENSISALGRKIRVEQLHADLDKLDYRGERPPLKWNQLSEENNGNKK